MHRQLMAVPIPEAYAERMLEVFNPFGCRLSVERLTDWVARTVE